MKPSFLGRCVQPIEGSYVVAFRENDDGAGRRLLRNQLGIREFVHSADWKSGARMTSSPGSTGVAHVYDRLHMCCVRCHEDDACCLHSQVPLSSILAIEQDHEVFMMESRDGEDAAAATYLDTANVAWGLTASRAAQSKYSGQGVRVAVLDTGIARDHSDFSSANLQQVQSFVADSDPHDANGHGTHCAGIVFGQEQPQNAPTYGVAHHAEIYIAKTLDDQGVGSATQVLTGLNWAVENRCDIVSMSLGADIRAQSIVLEEAGRRALNSGSLVVAPAGNNASRANHDYGFVIRPANSRYIMAVGAVDRNLQTADFSARSSLMEGGEVDIMAPGVDIFSSWPGAERYRSLSGTSMAVPFVSGIAALYAQAYGLRGRALWNALLESATALPHSAVDVGAGLVQAPRDS